MGRSLRSSVFRALQELVDEWRLRNAILDDDIVCRVLEQQIPTSAETFANALDLSIFTRLCRLLDPAKSNGHRNASLRGVMEDKDTPDDVKKSIDKSLQAIDDNVMQRIKDTRNKLIMHTDAAVATSSAGFGQQSRLRDIADVMTSLEQMWSTIASTQSHHDDPADAVDGSQEFIAFIRHFDRKS